ncbi:succinate dehydrogenase [Telmatospirillum sp. J64-1]|uniref:succinate dehydrogenase n=1 Tax=Telmatospirillum sp. J64-1 TaxID=2502183 RepID=UPI00115D5A5B|nr:succinate dehydrogenase [Telmatospirillum sp. J64-1]
MTALRIYMAQRISAMIMVPLVFMHLGMIIYAVQGGLSAEEILGRTRGSIFWACFYGLFVTAVSVHGAAGIRVIVTEMVSLRKGTADLLTYGIFLLLFVMGARAVVAVTMP